MYCEKCNRSNPEGAAFCRYCGSKLKTSEGTRPVVTVSPERGQDSRGGVQYVQTQPQYSAQNSNYGYAPMRGVREEDLPTEYKPIRAWGYFGYMLLFSIPIVGFIFLIVFVVSAQNVNLKYFARSYFCSLVIILIVVLIATVLVGGDLLYYLY